MTAPFVPKRRRAGPAWRALTLPLAVAAACGGTGGRPAPATGAPRSAALAGTPRAADPAAALDGRAPSPAEARTMDRLFREAERLRELPFRSPVPVRVQDRAAIVEHLERELDADELDAAARLYTALGLLEPGLDIRALLLRVLGEQVVGYYDTKRGFLAVRDDVIAALGAPQGAGSRGDEASIVLVHEMIHALQAQHLGIAELDAEELDTDAANAIHALIEGDASLAMIGYATARGGLPLDALTRNPLLLRQMVRAAPAMLGEELGQAPAIVRAPLLAAYLEGLVFAAHLHGHGGWPSVDRAFEEPPAATEHILHPETFLAGEAPFAITLEALAPLAEEGLRVLDEDTLGELELAVYLGLATGADRDEVAAAGWAGDRLRLYERPDGEAAVVWFTAWDTDRDAGEAQARAATIATRGAAAGASASVERRGRFLLVTRHLPEAARSAAHAAFATAVTAWLAADPVVRAASTPEAATRPRARPAHP